MPAKKSVNQIRVVVNPKLYSLEAVYGAAYAFLDRAYIFLDQNSKKEILVTLKQKEELSKKELDVMAGEFQNALLSYSLRNEISKNNRKIREYIVGRALIGVLPENEEIDESKEEIQEWKGDDLGIAVPWEKKFAKKTRTKTSRE
ncbi:MAG: hypothetical protein UX15_C0015G0005 [Parcubacteria group bacterium GW2011_GWA1_45_7]|nr:MAG: hypothetical protein UX15_C0015G0005 [Parcubacteria group bacterium GW2011_GWA1_45_7]KKU11188.1 MAG: hypothetical protein UX14_C0001G0007 [Parcubacteria group bacterium GW2011_GWF1_45_5]KKU47395.1 MAG: hypothetical protein UX66_C0015G0012 [Parcubacteria group bacterium GW2011_GWF2_46_8]